MIHGPRTGSIEVIAGVMFSGKSEELLRRVRRAQIARKRVQVFKSHLDERYAGIRSVSSHDGRSLEAVPIGTAGELVRLMRPDTEIVAVDETQFLDDAIIDMATMLANRGVRMILAGTDTDFRGEPFGAMAQLMAIAELVDKLRAICMVCGDLACRNQRLIDGRPAPYDSPIILVGGSDSYEARCRHCHRVPRRDEDQTALL
ncbi:MAG TPA: thymidine kinase [Gemmatimonadales bacterium]|nr:thymidine kinase [Gemmatimonadales bacterium]